MRDFSGRLAVITGGASGIGRALACQLAAEGCSLALCDLDAPGLEETRRLAEAGAPQGVTILVYQADVTDETALNRFADAVRQEHKTDHVHLLFNNAGIGGGGSFVASPREQWDRVFDICWGGVYKTARAFLPLLLAAPKAHLINVSSVNGFWAWVGGDAAHTAYSAAKFAVKGFTEGLVVDFRVNAPHVKVSLVMPGHIGTPILLNSQREFIADQTGSHKSDPVLGASQATAERFRDFGLPPTEAAAIILQGVRNETWRILVGADAVSLDLAVRQDPDGAYDPAFVTLLAERRKQS